MPIENSIEFSIGIFVNRGGVNISVLLAPPQKAYEEIYPPDSIFHYGALLQRDLCDLSNFLAITLSRIEELNETGTLENYKPLYKCIEE